MNARGAFNYLVPPALAAALRRWSGRTLRFEGRPSDWRQAERMSSGYDAAVILDRVARATRAVVRSDGMLHERDGVLLERPEYPFAILTGLLRAATANGGRLNVIDFGGSLGGIYRQCRPLLADLSQLRWWVVEQPAFVAAGQAEFATPELGFAGAIADIDLRDDHAVVLASSVLQYLEDPDAVLEQFARSPAHHLIIDRTPMSLLEADRLCVQKVPAFIYPASYPCWIFSRPRLLQTLARDWQLVCAFPGAEGAMRTNDGVAFEFEGMILERKR